MILVYLLWSNVFFLFSRMAFDLLLAINRLVI